MKTIKIVALLLFATTTLYAQQFPIYSQHQVNPYILNPGAIATQGVPEFNLSYRQEWSGIKNGPKTIQGDIQLPINNKLSVGLNLINDRTILLSQFSGYLTFGYSLPISETHFLKFGLSGGLTSNQIKLSDLGNSDPNDPVLLNSSNNTDFDGQFGMFFSNKKLTMGFSLLKLVETKSFSAEDQVGDYTFDPFKDKSAFISYRFRLSNMIDLQPYLLYRTTFLNSTYYEGTAHVHIANRVSVGAGYRTDFGLIGMLRVNISRISAGFSYDLPSSTVSNGTQEFQLKYLLKKSQQLLAEESEKNKDTKETAVTTTQNEKTKIPVVTETEPKVDPKQEATSEDVLLTEAVTEETYDQVHEQITVQEQEQVAAIAKNETLSIENKIQDANSGSVKTTAVQSSNNSPNVPKKTVEVVSETTEDHTKKPVAKQTSEPKYFFIVGSFANKTNAQKLLAKYKKEGVDASLRQIGDNYYVYLPEFGTDEISMEKLMSIRYSTPHAEGWFKQVNP